MTTFHRRKKKTKPRPPEIRQILDGPWQIIATTGGTSVSMAAFAIRRDQIQSNVYKYREVYRWKGGIAGAAPWLSDQTMWKVVGRTEPEVTGGLFKFRSRYFNQMDVNEAPPTTPGEPPKRYVIEDGSTSNHAIGTFHQEGWYQVTMHTSENPGDDKPVDAYLQVVKVLNQNIWQEVFWFPDGFYRPWTDAGVIRRFWTMTWLNPQPADTPDIPGGWNTWTIDVTQSVD